MSSHFHKTKMDTVLSRALLTYRPDSSASVVLIAIYDLPSGDVSPVKTFSCINGTGFRRILEGETGEAGRALLRLLGGEGEVAMATTARYASEWSCSSFNKQNAFIYLEVGRKVYIFKTVRYLAQTPAEQSGWHFVKHAANSLHPPRTDAASFLQQGLAAGQPSEPCDRHCS